MDELKLKQKGRDIYKCAQNNGLIKLDRWEKGIGHHPKSLELMGFIAEHDFKDYSDMFCWKTGGDGDNGESLMYEMDAYFEQKDIEEKNQ